jgi:hypothetical protein
VSDIDTEAVDSLKVLDPNRPIREATNVRLRIACREGLIVLQNSFLGCVQNFPEALVRSLEHHVRGHMIDPISNRRPS